MKFPNRSFLFGRFVFGLAAALLLTVNAHASTQPLAGKYSGTYVGKGNDGTVVTGPTDVKFAAKSGGSAGLMNLKGIAPDNDNTKFKAKVIFNADGTCSTTALIPGVLPVAGTGTWKINKSGKKISYELSGTVNVLFFSTVVSTKGTIKISGKKLKISGNGKANPPVPFSGVPSEGTYSYVGQ